MRPFLKWHLGLGDAIICAPLAVELAKLHDGLDVPCYEHNLASVQSLFVNHPHIAVVPLANEFRVHEYAKAQPLVIPIGFYKETPQLPGETFDRFLYHTAGVNFEHRWDPVVAEAVETLYKGVSLFENNFKHNVFVHEDMDRGFEIDRDVLKEFSQARPYFLPTKIGDILCFAGILLEVDQIHVIDSSFLHLAESLPVTGALYLHRYARPETAKRREAQPELRKNWRILE